MNEKYLDTKTKFTETTFDKNEFFNLILELLVKNKVQVDDFKANIFPQKIEKMTSWDKSILKIKSVFNWIVYPEETPKSEFMLVSNKIEQIIREAFNLNSEDECRCYRYDDSEYSGRGYDAELKLEINYDYCE
jgi:hypothetical protein